MLPIALTCPVWWVARWAARMLASLAVVVAFSLGAATLPAGAPATAPVPSGPITGLTVRGAADPRAERGDLAAERRRDSAAARQAAPAGAPEPPLAGAAPAPVGRLSLPGRQPPALAGPRAPPAR
ncbi:hypothetical protein [Micromonospora sp. WMMD980]|uniref:hypothetical protein n=1 Tax=Micromonospora sp. WMMD980 TaxID=3016088 RepID=UPI0024161727|nr:hypothetical protein [Micromonospora sp. WMMD980]MDG4801867.1 hypothetical protein [Micromonospora sp. WMMD980]